MEIQRKMEETLNNQRSKDDKIYKNKKDQEKDFEKFI